MALGTSRRAQKAREGNKEAAAAALVLEEPLKRANTALIIIITKTQVYIRKHQLQLPVSLPLVDTAVGPFKTATAN